MLQCRQYSLNANRLHHHRKALGDWAKGVGLAGNMALISGQELPWGWSVADRVVFSNIKKAIGLDRSILNFSGMGLT